MKFFPTPLIEAKADILAHEPLFHMDWYIELIGDRDGGEIILAIDCGIGFCIAGSIVVRYFGVVVDEDGNPHPASVNDGKDWDEGWDDDWDGYAASVVGMTDADAECLFYSRNWGQISPEFHEIEPTPRNAIVVIDKFLRQKGFSPDGQPLKGEADAD